MNKAMVNRAERYIDAHNRLTNTRSAFQEHIGQKAVGRTIIDSIELVGYSAVAAISSLSFIRSYNATGESVSAARPNDPVALAAAVISTDSPK